MKKLSSLALIVIGGGVLSSAMPARAAAITEWTFDNLTAGTTNTSPTASTGSGTTASLGMALFTGPDASNIYALAGTDTDNTSATNNTWRIVGTNGWNSGAALGTQGAQFLSSTAGFTNISLSFDVDISVQGEANLQVQYTTDGTTWTNAALTFSGLGASILTNSSNANIVTGSYFHGNPTTSDTWFNGVTADLSGISAASNDAAFGVRIVNAATGSSDVNLKTNTALNNTSGNWRLDDVTISGTAAVPEPGTYALLVAGGLALGFIMRMKRS